MKDYIHIGCTPLEEECVQVGDPEYSTKSMAECSAFVRQLKRVFGDAPLRIKSFPHDFGSYREVVCMYDPEDDASVQLALKIERETPLEWDEEARKELNID